MITVRTTALALFVFMTLSTALLAQSSTTPIEGGLRLHWSSPVVEDGSLKQNRRIGGYKAFASDLPNDTTQLIRYQIVGGNEIPEPIERAWVEVTHAGRVLRITGRAEYTSEEQVLRLVDHLKAKYGHPVTQTLNQRDVVLKEGWVMEYTGQLEMLWQDTDGDAIRLTIQAIGGISVESIEIQYIHSEYMRRAQEQPDDF